MNGCEPRRVKAVLLAAGLGTRLRPLTDTVPKCLIPIAGCPLIGYWFAELARAGVRDVLINTHHLAERVRVYLEQVQRTSSIRVAETHERQLLGSAGTIHANRAWVDDAECCVIVYADNLSDVDMGAVVEYHISHDDPFTMVLFHAANPSACGIADLDGSDRIIRFFEKPKRPAGDLANAGVYVVDAEIYREIADMDAFDLGFEVLPRFVGRMRGWVHAGYHRDIGTPDALRQARADARRIFP